MYNLTSQDIYIHFFNALNLWTQVQRLEAQLKRSGGAGTKAEKALVASENKVADLKKELRQVDVSGYTLQ